MRIAVDIDSTLHHYWDQFAAVAKQRFGVDLPYETQHAWGVTGLRPEQNRACIAETHSEKHVLAATPYPGAVETSALARGRATSSRSPRTASPMRTSRPRRWLDEIGLPYDELHCSFDKISRCVELEIDVLIDDWPVNLRKAVEAGITAATIMHPWNRDLCEEEDVVCAPDWPTLAEKLEPVLA